MESNRKINKNKWIGLVTFVALGGFFVASTMFSPTHEEALNQTASANKNEGSNNLPTTKQHAAVLVENSAKKLAKSPIANKQSFPKVTPTQLENPFSPTLEGTDIDGKIAVGENGKIVMSMEVKDFFDYFLSAVGEVSPELALDEMIKTINESLPPENAEEAKVALANYLSYKEDAFSLMAQPMLPRDQQTNEYQLQVMEDTLRQLRDLRRLHMPEQQVQAFFGLEEEYEDYTLAAVRIQFDETLSSTEKAQLIEYERSQLPEEIRQTEVRVAEDNMKHEAIQNSMQAESDTNLVSMLDENGYSEEQKSQVLEYKQQQAGFDKRYQEYSVEKKSRLVDVSNSEEKQMILETLQSEYFFTEQELTQAKVRDLRG